MIQSLSPKIECKQSSENYGHFVIQPLEPGFGITLGNGLRRVLLSSLPGAAVTAVRIEGIQHEFSTIPHVKEDVIDFLLNVKQLRLCPLTDQPGRMVLEVSGEGRVCAGDIQPSADFEIANPELHLATLNSAEAELTVELYVEQGKGYCPAGHGNGLPIGVIPVDAIFTPVRKVNYAVEKTRVGQMSNYDRLNLEIWTNGTISPSEALTKSSQILITHFSLFQNVGEVMLEASEQTLAIPAEQYNMPLDQFGLSTRTLNCLRRAKITRVGELAEKSREGLLQLGGFGQKSLDEVWALIESLGLAAEPEKEEEVKAEDTEAAEGEWME